MTDKELQTKGDLNRLVCEGCFGNMGNLLRWPEWLSWEELQGMVEEGLMLRQTYGPSTYAHTSYYIADLKTLDTAPNQKG